MKHLRFLLCLALVAALLTACGPKGDGSASSSGSGGAVPHQSHPGGLSL